MHEGWAVRVEGERIDAVGPAASIDAAGAKVIDLPGTTLMPGLIEGHSHVLLHPYNETSWNDQVAHEALALRVARAVNHLRATLLAGFTTMRDLGTEGAGYADVGLKQAVDQGIIPGPRMLVVDARDRRDRQLRAERLRARVARAAGRAKKPTASMAHARRPRPDRARRRLDQGLRRLPLGPACRAAPDVHAGGAEARRRDRAAAAARRSRCTRARAEGHAARDLGRRRNDRAWRRGDAGSLQADGGETRRAVPHARRRRRDRAVRAAGRKASSPSRPASRASARASRRRSPPASRSSAAATSACSRTATTRARSR